MRQYPSKVTLTYLGFDYLYLFVRNLIMNDIESDLVRHRIQILTAALHELQNTSGQGLAERIVGEYSAPPSERVSTRGKFLSQLAILLSRGTRLERDKTISVFLTLEPDRTELFVAGSSSEDRPVSQTFLSHNADLEDGSPGKSRHRAIDIMDDELTNPRQDLLDFSHDFVPAAIRILLHAAHSRNFDFAHRFFTYQCLEKLETRYAQFKALYTVKPPKGGEADRSWLFQNWKPAAGETLEQEEVDFARWDASSVAQHLREQLKTPPEAPENEFVVLFSTEAAPVWMDLLGDYCFDIGRCISETYASTDDESLDFLSARLWAFRVLVQAIPLSLWKLQSVRKLLSGTVLPVPPILDDKLGKVAKSQDVGPGVSVGFGNESDSSEAGIVPDDLGDTYTPDTEKAVAGLTDPGATYFLQAIAAVCAVPTAVEQVSQSRSLQKIPSIAVTSIDLPNSKPAFQTDMEELAKPFNSLVEQKKLEPKLERRVKDQLQSALSGLRGDKPQYAGACHCEAGIMATIAYSVSTLSPTSSSTSSSQLPDALKTLHATISEHLQPRQQLEIGLANKSCPTCWLLADLINSNSTMNLRIKLPGHHTRFHPWTAPAWLPPQILQVLYRRLLGEWLGMIDDLDERSRVESLPDHGNSKINSANRRRLLARRRIPSHA